MTKRWQREAAWLGLAALIGHVVLTGFTFGFAFAFQIVPMIAAFFLGGVGWFFGDLLQEFMFMKQTGARRR